MRTSSACSPAFSESGLVRARRIGVRLVVAVISAVAIASPLAAQSRVGSDSSTRIARYWHDLTYGTALGFVYAGVDQARNNPVEWGKGWSGYGKRSASNIGEFLIQETTTDLLAAALNRPLDYQRCRCSGTGARLGWWRCLP
jgi:hypothetical protein